MAEGGMNTVGRIPKGLILLCSAAVAFGVGLLLARWTAGGERGAIRSASEESTANVPLGGTVTPGVPGGVEWLEGDGTPTFEYVIPPVDRIGAPTAELPILDPDDPDPGPYPEPTGWATDPILGPTPSHTPIGASTATPEPTPDATERATESKIATAFAVPYPTSFTTRTPTP